MGEYGGSIEGLAYSDVAIGGYLECLGRGDEYGSWDWDFLRRSLPDHIILYISAILPPSIVAGPDRLTWKWVIKGDFSSVETYYGIYQYNSTTTSCIWRLIWKGKVPQRVKLFLSLLWKGRILTNDE